MRTTTKDGFKLSGAAIAGIVVSVVLAAALTLAWARYVHRPQLDIEARNRRATFERQDTDRDLISRKIVEYEDAGDESHRKALVDLICRTADEVRGSLTGNSAAFVGEHCR